MPYWLGTLITLSLPFVVFILSWQVFAWWLQRVPVGSKAMRRAEALGPPPPPVQIVDAKGNVRHEWAADLLLQRLRSLELPRR
jgi:hypothetical protein